MMVTVADVGDETSPVRLNPNVSSPSGTPSGRIATWQYCVDVSPSAQFRELVTGVAV